MENSSLVIGIETYFSDRSVRIVDPVGELSANGVVVAAGPESAVSFAAIGFDLDLERGFEFDSVQVFGLDLERVFEFDLEREFGFDLERVFGFDLEREVLEGKLNFEAEM